MKILTILTLLAFLGCSSNTSVTLRRLGGFSGIEEQYRVDQSGNGTRTMRMPDTSQSKVYSFRIDQTLTEHIIDLVHDRWTDFDTIQLHGKSNMTSGINIDQADNHLRMTWPNLDPPPLGTTSLDSLYQFMMEAEHQMTTK